MHGILQVQMLVTIRCAIHGEKEKTTVRSDAKLQNKRISTRWALCEFIVRNTPSFNMCEIWNFGRFVFPFAFANNVMECRTMPYHCKNFNNHTKDLTVSGFGASGLSYHVAIKTQHNKTVD